MVENVRRLVQADGERYDSARLNGGYRAERRVGRASSAGDPCGKTGMLEGRENRGRFVASRLREA